MDSNVNSKANKTNSEGLYFVNITQNNVLKIQLGSNVDGYIKMANL